MEENWFQKMCFAGKEYMRAWLLQSDDIWKGQKEALLFCFQGTDKAPSAGTLMQQSQA